MECLIENTPLWIRVTVLSLLLTNKLIRGICDVVISVWEVGSPACEWDEVAG